MLTTSYEVIRPFPGSPEKGAIIDARDIRPANAEGLVKSRHLRPLALGAKSRADEQADWLAKLTPYAAIMSPADAAAGSEIARLHQASVAASKQASALEAKAGKLRAQLEKAQAIISEANQGSDFARIATVQAEVSVVGRLWEAADREAQAARRAADDAERELVKRWRDVENARVLLPRLIAGDLGDHQANPRWALGWQILRALDVPQQAA